MPAQHGRRARAVSEPSQERQPIHRDAGADTTTSGRKRQARDRFWSAIGRSRLIDDHGETIDTLGIGTYDLRVFTDSSWPRALPGAGEREATTAATAHQLAREVGRWSWPEQAKPLLLILGSALTASLFTVGSVTLTGDRLLGLAALGVATGLGVAGRVRWTPIHSALAVFVGAQVLTTLLNAAAWPQGLKFVTVYALGFACFCLAAEWARGSERRHRFVAWWITVGAALGVVGTVVTMWANLTQQGAWGTGIAQGLFFDPKHPTLMFAAKATFGEWNLLSSFLLIPFALGLWLWRPDAEVRASPWRTASVAAVVFGLVFGCTRAAWLSMAGLITFWWWVRRPRWRQLVALGSMLALAFLLQAAALGGTSPLWFRMVEPVKAGYDVNMQGRLAISRATIPSWLDRPVEGHGAGSINRLSALVPAGGPTEKMWNGNLVLFVLHDSGLLGLAALLSLGVVVWRRGARAIRREAHGATPSLAVPLLAVGGALCFAYQFTHALWLMYPYVYLGLLTAATDHGSQEVSRCPGPPDVADACPPTA
jgi:hypothetical protein